MAARVGKSPHHALGALVVLSLFGCTVPQIPIEALRLEESALEVRAAQTRTMAAPSEAAILAATIAVLQDMEFNVDRIERPLGVISASKVSDADSTREKVGLFLLDVLCGADCGNLSRAKDEQHLILTLVVLPSLARSEEYTARVTLQRIIYDQEERVVVRERITTPETYQEIFDNLRRSLAIEVGGT